MRLLGLLLNIFAIVSKGEDMCYKKQQQSNNCIQFTVGSGTGCDWMCNYCANQLGTYNYYFTDNVCTYQEGQGCVGSPVAGKQYTCCSA
jgi:hypothetical protein